MVCVSAVMMLGVDQLAYIIYILNLPWQDSIFSVIHFSFHFAFFVSFLSMIKEHVCVGYAVL